MEASAFLAVLALLSFIYFITKFTDKEDIFYNKWLLIFGALLILAYGLALLIQLIRVVILKFLCMSPAILFSQLYCMIIIRIRKEFSIALMAPVVMSAF